MPVPPWVSSRRSILPAIPRRPVGALLAALSICAAAIGPALASPLPGADLAPTPVSHIVISEVMTGGASASDEFVELYNPSGTEQALDGLELVYVTASGATLTRKAAWDAGTPPLLPGAHLLVGNEAGAYAVLADTTYANGLAATGGSVALRVAGASDAIDAVGWGTAVSAWLEGTPAVAPSSGASLERLPGGPLGSGQDTDDNAADFVILATPDPQNRLSAPVPDTTSPSPSPTATVTPAPTAEPTAQATNSPTQTPMPPTPSPTPTSTPVPTSSPSPSVAPSPTTSPTPTPSASPAIVSIAEARALPDGSVVTIAGVALTDSAFSEGGGYIADATAGVAVLLSDGAFARGETVTVTGAIGDRYAQRTLRSDGAHVAIGNPGVEPAAIPTATGGIGEETEGGLVVISGLVVGAGTQLSSGTAFDLDDGTGAVRVLVGPATGIDTSGWAPGVALRVTGIVGQRDSSGTGTAGYRVQPRDAADVEVLPESSPSPSATPNGSPTPAPSGSSAPVVSIAAARDAGTGTDVKIRGVVTMGSGVIDPTSAVVQDASGGMLVRIDDDLARLVRGRLVELVGTRSTRSGMLTVRVDTAPTVLGDPGEPRATSRATGAISEQDEAQLVVVAGTITSSVLRSTANNVSFTVDDGSGDIRVVLLARAGIPATGLAKGVHLVVRGVVGQETSGAQPERGYRIWPRDRDDLQIAPLPVLGGSEPTVGTGGGNAVPSSPVPGDVSARSTMVAPVLGIDAPAATLDSAPAALQRQASTEPLASSAAATSRAIAVLFLGLAALVLIVVAGWQLGVAARLRERWASAPPGLDGEEG